MFNPQLDEIVSRKFGPNIPSMTELEHRTAIAFVNTNPVFNIPAPLPENVIPVGGLHIGDTKPLPKVITRPIQKSVFSCFFNQNFDCIFIGYWTVYCVIKKRSGFIFSWNECSIKSNGFGQTKNASRRIRAFSRLSFLVEIWRCDNRFEITEKCHDSTMDTAIRHSCSSQNQSLLFSLRFEIYSCAYQITAFVNWSAMD